jgi:hypothetical protein
MRKVALIVSDTQLSEAAGVGCVETSHPSEDGEALHALAAISLSVRNKLVLGAEPKRVNEWELQHHCNFWRQDQGSTRHEDAPTAIAPCRLRRLQPREL